MHMKVPEIAVPLEDPFANDKLQRRNSGELLTNFLRSVPTPYVMTIDAEWGQGKTTFLRMWRQFLEKDRFPVCYFNAWEADHERDPLIALIAEIRHLAGQIGDALPQKEAAWIRDLAAAFSKSGMRLTEYAYAKMAIAAAAPGKGTAHARGKPAEDALDEYHKHKQSLLEFRDALAALAPSLSGRDNRPLVVLVDDLDHCWPSYAVELIEKVKHLLSVEGVVFVFAFDRRQLAAVVKAVYGQEFDGDGYLKRHFDLEYRFPEPNLSAYCDFLYHALQFGNLVKTGRLHPDYADPLRNFISLSARAMGATPRDVGHILTRIYVSLAIGEPERSPDPRIVVLLAFIRYLDADLYAAIVRRSVTADQLVARFSSVANPDVAGNERDAAIFHAFLYVLLENQGRLRARAEQLKHQSSGASRPDTGYNRLLVTILEHQGMEGEFRGPAAVEHARRGLELAVHFRA